MSLSEEDRVRIIAELKRNYPNGDIDSKLSGLLAGPADEVRPPVPIWDYLEWYEKHPGARLAAMRDIRIPVMLPGGEESVLALSDDMFVGDGASPPISEEDVVRLYAMLHEAGVVTWDEERNMLRYVDSASARADVVRRWLSGLRRDGE